ncbi:hypothetical protein EQ836_05130 [Ectopseudomonas mendocina]|jgi:hypothetical protein|uniref:Phosphotransferase system, HPr-related protein n=1 Tax=Ectopseudomonas mendocina TaxID=300 RepID=A0A379IV22_ECTME|nr:MULTISPECIES: hypothetical protein [Pseudomonas]TRO16129.1 hypothetical protein EQ829_04880 [Pseudomonas mendocina]TRO20272.1 hypothetical protein EQ836_05130 [Pseudomonas mendocina]TRO40953.1 hypothetical protein EQ832_04680 [Pseudomonas sp. ALS1131]SUD40157.1 phosphotransferase system, HPr-related protein [Pseudomonas mendocina]
MKDTTPGPTPERIDEQALDFSDDEDSLGTGEPSLQQSARPSSSAEDEIGLTGAATLGESEHEDNVSLDDLSPDTLIDDSGARSPLERGGDGANDEELSVVDESQVGGGFGLDEAELARSAPIDGKPWTDEVVPTDEVRKP